MTMIAPRTSGLAAAAISALCSGFELVRVIAIGGRERGFATSGSLFMAILFSVVLALAALGLAAHRQLGYVAGVLAAISALSYGVVLRAGGNAIGIAYMFAAMAIFALIVRSLPYYREERAT
ncbi:MAG: hypothetical protein JWP87_1502 [Labilithrix sp.]|nr:hypothetical protein [Labilithrix sp.]